MVATERCLANGKNAEIDFGMLQHFSALHAEVLSGSLLKFCPASLFCLQRLGGALNPK